MSQRALGRNEACWCGSGLKYKKCHLEADLKAEGDRTGSAEPRAREYWEIQRDILPASDGGKGPHSR
jgi:methionyl aminopeptidase